MSYALENSLGVSNPNAKRKIEVNEHNLMSIANMFRCGSQYCPPDYKKALEYYQKVEELDDYYYSCVADCNEKIGLNCFESEDYYSAIEYFLEAINNYELYIDYCRNNITESEDEDDVEFWQDIIEINNTSIGWIYYKISKCYEQMSDDGNQFKYLKLAVEFDDEFCLATYGLGTCYFCGIGTSENPEKAAHCFYKAAEQDYPDAYYPLGACYELGLGVEEDVDRAREIYEAGAELGSEKCEERLAKMNEVSYIDSGVSASSQFLTKDNLKKGLKTGAKALGIIGSLTGNMIVSGLADGAESLISSIMDEDDI